MFSFLKSKISEGYDKLKKLVTGKGSLTEEEMKAIETFLFEHNFSSTFITHIRHVLKETDEKDSIEWIDKLKKVLKSIIVQAKECTEKKCVMLVGINGAGKTTTSIKLARNNNKNNTALLIAADTFRAAAQDQLRELAEEYHVDMYEEHNVDPAAVVFRGCEKALSMNKEKIIIDTAGRIHQNDQLLKELQKIQKVAFNKIGNDNCSTFLVLDSLQGQALIEQVKQFLAYITIDGIILTKLDALSKPGIVFSLMETFKIPIVYLSYGEHSENIEKFDGDKFINLVLE